MSHGLGLRTRTHARIFRDGSPANATALGVRATAEEILAALRDFHVNDEAVPVTALPKALYTAVLQRFGSIAAARERLGIGRPALARVWSRKKVVAELRRLFRIGVEPTSSNLRRHRGLMGAIRNHVGSLREARALAGLPGSARKATKPAFVWDDLEVARMIERRAKNGEPLATSQVPSNLYNAARKYWGSWARAIEAAGLDYAAIRRVRAPWTKPAIVAELRRLRASHPTMTRTELSQRGLSQACVHEFGSLDHALRAAQLRGWPRRLREKLGAIPFEKLRAALRALKRRGVPLMTRRIAEHDPHLLRSLRRSIAGPWREVLAALGFEDPTPRWDRERVLLELREVHARGQALNARANSKLATRARYHFGSLANAVKALGAGATIRPHVHRSRKEVLKALRRLGRGLPYVSSRLAGAAFASSARKHFGSWRRACEVAGVQAGPPGGRVRGTPRSGHARR